MKNRKLRWFVLGPVLLLLCYFVSLLTYGTLTDWQPEPEETLKAIHAGEPEPVVLDSIVKLLTWNVGYGGLASEVAFFYDQGDFFWTSLGHVRPDENIVEAAVDGQESTVLAVPADFYLLQEVDTAARRSYYTNQLDSMAQERPDYATYFAMNFKNGRVPIPVFQPWDHYGYVRGGLVSMTKYEPQNSMRYSLPGKLGWPTRLFSLDRCVLRQEFATRANKKLVVYNIHLSAYDQGGGAKAEQMAWLRERVLADYEMGNYVIVGGDWNQVPPGFDYAVFSPDRADEYSQIAIDFDYLPQGWLWAYDPDTPTNRKANEVYDEKHSQKSLIDFYLLSPNLKLKQVKAIDQNFAHSDHQPVYLEAEMIE